MRAAIMIGVLGLTSSARAEAPWIEPAAVVEALVTATATIDPTTPAGGATVLARVANADTTAIASVRAALAKTTFVVLEDVTERTGAMWTVEATSGARATIRLSATSGSIIVTARPVTKKLPGACVAIPSARHEVDVNSTGVDQEGERRSSTRRWSLSSTRLADVDGDGLLDVFVPIAPSKTACPEAVSWRVYVARGTCGHVLGVVGPGSLDLGAAAAPLDASGFRPLVLSAQTAAYEQTRVPERSPVPVMTTTTRSFAVKRGRYARVAETKRDGRCHHCAVWRCTPP